MRSRKVWLALLVVAAVAALWASGLTEHLSVEALAAQRAALQEQAAASPVLAPLLFTVIYVIIAASSLPVAVPLTLLGGAVFGFLPALVYVSFASSIGATLASAVSRYLFADLVRRRFGRLLGVVDRGLARDGVAWLLAVRLVPAFPFFVVNLLLGLSLVPLRTIYWTSQLGMLPGTAVFVWAGAELGLVSDASELLSPRLIAAFVALAALPFVLKAVTRRLRREPVEATQNATQRPDDESVGGVEGDLKP